MTRRRLLLAVLAVCAVAITVLAVTDRKAAYMTLYGLGAILLVLGSAAGFGGGAAGALPGGHPSDFAKIARSDMQQRMGWLSGSLLLLLAGAVSIGIAVLLNLA
jgi:hypothetical protein